MWTNRSSFPRSDNVSERSFYCFSVVLMETAKLANGMSSKHES